ncbi:lysosomal-associated transmembrane protein 4B [Rousettus aegyptiacus]|uniref:Lysosomal-associated transmembrane protein 4B n=2 Tax=Rousettus aegyptiacus TaxID=9407 RepID=A0A7J8C254_ROUAE|nr:lysosomal-associated transmembrane protein 4B [Rousettus aegyptiacus]KAF6404926.1 lysosomal protein transmembrane 4 beta [Rousettus aegyptiacus]
MIYLFTVGWRRPQLAGACGDITGQGAGHVPRRPPHLRLLRLLPPPSEQRVRRQLRPRGALGGDAERRPEGEQASGHEPGRCRSGLGAGSSRAASGVTRPRFLQTWARARATAPAARAMKMVAPWTRFYSNSCCLCCHVRTGTILLGIWYLIINAVVLLILLSALADPDQYHFSSSELGGDFEFMDDANMCIAIAISLLMILICAMATYGAYKQHAAWIIPFFCYQIFDFALNALVAVTVLVYPNSIQEYIRQLPPNFPHKDDIMSVNPTCLVLIILLFISIILTFKGYLISCVWNCYRYINGRNSSDVLVYVTSNDTTVLLPPYDDATVNGAAKEPPPPYVSA